MDVVKLRTGWNTWKRDIFIIKCSLLSSMLGLPHRVKSALSLVSIVMQYQSITTVQGVGICKPGLISEHHHSSVHHIQVSHRFGLRLCPPVVTRSFGLVLCVATTFL